MSFTINNKLSFFDSFQFLSSSLDSSVKNLSKDDFKYLSQEFDNNVLDLVKEEGFYPSEYMSDFEKFNEELPSKEKFYSLLTDKKISDKEYEQVVNVWKKFEMKALKDYYDLYLKCDVLLLANVFEKFRNISLSRDTMLKMAYIFFEKGKIFVTSHISNRYDPKEESRHIIYLDANNLYVYAISNFLPTSGIKIVDPKEFELNKCPTTMVIIF